jgi:hypothetical protein
MDLGRYFFQTDLPTNAPTGTPKISQLQDDWRTNFDSHWKAIINTVGYRSTNFRTSASHQPLQRVLDAIRVALQLPLAFLGVASQSL